jgi:hypothetical protein
MKGHISLFRFSYIWYSNFIIELFGCCPPLYRGRVGRVYSFIVKRVSWLVGGLVVGLGLFW